MVSDEFNGTWFANYSMGPVSIVTKKCMDAGLTGQETTTHYKTVGTSGGIFDGDPMSIAFNVNDNLSVFMLRQKKSMMSRWCKLSC